MLRRNAKCGELFKEEKNFLSHFISNSATWSHYSSENVTVEWVEKGTGITSYNDYLRMW